MLRSEIEPKHKRKGWQHGNLKQFHEIGEPSAKGEAPQGLDKGKLENGVYEQLREADLIK
jgi:hypothetical protein